MPVRTPHGYPFRRLCVVLSLLFSPLQGHAAEASVPDVTLMSLEDILNTEVVSASKKAQRISRAPADVTVIHADDIRLFGWRTLADVLRATRGFYISNDYTYEYTGVRGFSPPGDYNTRLLILVDGNRLNDPVYDSGLIGGELPIDMGLIDRIEIVRGPSSSVYGSNAFLGVINLITRRGHQLDGMEADFLAAENYIGHASRASYGRRLASGMELLLSATHSESDGADQYFAEFDDPATNNGVTSGTDYEDRDQLFIKLDRSGWSLTAGHGRRTKGQPTAPAGSEFNNPATSYVDQETFGEVAYRKETSAGEFAARLFAGDYRFWGNAAYAGASLSNDDARGSWNGVEVRQGLLLGDQHHVVAGVEYQDNHRLFQTVFDEDPYARYLRRDVSMRRLGVYLQDDWTLGERWSATLGLRYDSVSPSYAERQSEVSPRLALIYGASSEATLKLLYGHAFRMPNVYESQYLYPFDPGRQLDNPALAPETIETLELVWERYIGTDTRIILAGYTYKLHDFIALSPVSVANAVPPPPTLDALQFRNQSAIDAQGLELELEHRFAARSRLRASYGFQRPHINDDEHLTNAPSHLGKLNLVLPLWRDDLDMGFEMQASSRRLADSGAYAPGYAIANANVLWRIPAARMELSFSVRNLFDAHHYDPAADDGVAGRSLTPQRARELAAGLRVRF